MLTSKNTQKHNDDEGTEKIIKTDKNFIKYCYFWKSLGVEVLKWCIQSDELKKKSINAMNTSSINTNINYATSKKEKKINQFYTELQKNELMNLCNNKYLNNKQLKQLRYITKKKTKNQCSLYENIISVFICTV